MNRDFYIADQLVSLNIILYDFEQSFCYYVYDVWYPCKFLLVVDFALVISF